MTQYRLHEVSRGHRGQVCNGSSLTFTENNEESSPGGVGGAISQRDDVGGKSKSLGRSDGVCTVQINGVATASKLEHRLAERDMELRTLRQTMERNEIAMLRVIDDRKRAWVAELKQHRYEWQSLVKDHQDRCERTAKLLKDEIARLEREQESLKDAEERERELKSARASRSRLTAELESKQAEVRKLHAALNEHPTSGAHCVCPLVSV